MGKRLKELRKQVQKIYGDNKIIVSVETLKAEGVYIITVNHINQYKTGEPSVYVYTNEIAKLLNGTLYSSSVPIYNGMVSTTFTIVFKDKRLIDNLYDSFNNTHETYSILEIRQKIIREILKYIKGDTIRVRLLERNVIKAIGKCEPIEMDHVLNNAKQRIGDEIGNYQMYIEVDDKSIDGNSFAKITLSDSLIKDILRKCEKY